MTCKQVRKLFQRPSAGIELLDQPIAVGVGADKSQGAWCSWFDQKNQPQKRWYPLKRDIVVRYIQEQEKKGNFLMPLALTSHVIWLAFQDAFPCPAQAAKPPDGVK